VKGRTHLSCLKNRNYQAPLAIFSAFEYSETVRKCIKTAKYKRKIFAPLKILALEALKIMSKTETGFERYLVVPIPLSKKRSKSRGFNQAGIVAGLLANNLSLTFHKDLLQRTKETTAQYERNRKERFANLRNAFICHKDLTGKKILLVDDICTTGATLLEGSKALFQAGAEEISCFTLAKKF
jgi:competence protein ComFC